MCSARNGGLLFIFNRFPKAELDLRDDRRNDYLCLVIALTLAINSGGDA